MVAFVQRPAPAFTATAVAEGEFKDISLSEFVGQWYASFTRQTFVRAWLTLTLSARVVLFFYPM